ncbi:MAG: hypothetical protein MUF54_24280 [Polyangiaceae bacterium]|jgi:hypothetical protein|nr:hypothetical protein [Polyangiaceae bacterium]
MRFLRPIALSIPLFVLACGSDDTSLSPSPRLTPDAGHDSAPPTDAAVDTAPYTDASADATPPTDATADTTPPTDASQDATTDLGDTSTGPEVDGDGSAPPETGPDTGPDASVENQALHTYAVAFCGLIDRCAPFMLGFLYGDEATCVTRYMAGGRPALLPQAAGINKTADDVIACASAMDAMTCEHLYAGARTTACPVIPGALPQGAGCFTNLQCAAGFCDRAGACGRCAPRIGEGGACGIADDGCDEGLVCHAPTVADPPTCTPSAAEAEACGGGVVCRGYLTCRGGTCDQPGDVGDACDSSPGSCNGLLGLRCSAGRCVANAPFASEGQPCGVQGSSYVRCLGTSACDSNTKRCVLKHADGEACAAGSSNPCLYYASCKDNVCTVDSEPTCS